MTDKPSRSRQLVRAGVTAELWTAKGRTLDEIKKKIRSMAEKQVVILEQVSQKEFLAESDIDMLAKILKLIREVDGEVTEKVKDPSQMTDEELAKAAK